MSDPQHEVQGDRGERLHHERMEQLQMGDMNAETSIAESKEESKPREAQEPLTPIILEAPYTQHRPL